MSQPADVALPLATSFMHFYPKGHRERVDPTRNIRRGYTLVCQGSLFHEAVLVRTWGRIGSTRPQSRSLPCTSWAEARQAMTKLARRRLRRGYHLIRWE